MSDYGTLLIVVRRDGARIAGGEIQQLQSILNESIVASNSCDVRGNPFQSRAIESDDGLCFVLAEYRNAELTGEESLDPSDDEDPGEWDETVTGGDSDESGPADINTEDNQVAQQLVEELEQRIGTTYEFKLYSGEW